MSLSDTIVPLGCPSWASPIKPVRAASAHVHAVEGTVSCALCLCKQGATCSTSKACATWLFCMTDPYCKEASLQLTYDSYYEADTLTIAYAHVRQAADRLGHKRIEAHDLQVDDHSARPWPIQSSSQPFSTCSEILQINTRRLCYARGPTTSSTQLANKVPIPTRKPASRL